MKWPGLRTASCTAVLLTTAWCGRNAYAARGRGSTLTADASTARATAGGSTGFDPTATSGSLGTAPDGVTGAVRFSTPERTVDPSIRARCAALSRRYVRDVSLAEALEQTAASLKGDGHRDDVADDMLAVAAKLREPWAGLWSR